MRRAILAGAFAAIAAAAGAGVLVVQKPSPSIGGTARASADDTANPPLYYQDPDGQPSFSPTPKKTADGRDYVPVFAPADDPPAANQAHAAASSDRKIRFYRNPMGLPDTSPTPKKDSMGMDYIPVYEGEDSDDGSVRVSPGKIQRTGVRSEPATLRRIRSAIRAPGTIQLDERRVSVISMRSESWVQKVADVTTGTRVRKGQLLMDIYSPAISAAAAEYVATISSKTTGSETPYGRGSRQRILNLDVPADVIADLERDRTAPISVPWSSPRDGIVLERSAIEGMRAQPGDVLFRIADLSIVWAIVEVAERDLGGIAVGQPVTVTARGRVGRSFTGQISVINPQLNRETRTARVRIELENDSLQLLPDMYVDAAIDV